ncbi:hypothetical protein [Puniceibacterium antarcticum]|uniref:hypothetical protein n=1 Tax=Puniceibacterium antarcticum TaxID=1206336 RepID=UPI00117BD147|nr:hypothetical protein [Puniceibacterium antarcticum]
MTETRSRAAAWQISELPPGKLIEINIAASQLAYADGLGVQPVFLGSEDKSYSRRTVVALLSFGLTALTVGPAVAGGTTVQVSL